jgi:hypothetical protein
VVAVRVRNAPVEQLNGARIVAEPATGDLAYIYIYIYIHIYIQIYARNEVASIYQMPYRCIFHAYTAC